MPLLKSRKSYQRLGDDQEDSDTTKRLKKFNSGISSKFTKDTLKYKLSGISTKNKCDSNIDYKLHKNDEGTATLQLIDQFQEKEDVDSASYVSLFSHDNVNITDDKETTDIESSGIVTENIYASINEDIYSTINDSICISEDYMNVGATTKVNDSSESSHSKNSIVYEIPSEDHEDSDTERYEKIGNKVYNESQLDKRRFLAKSMFNLKIENNCNERGYPHSSKKYSNLSSNDEKLDINNETSESTSNIEYNDEEIYSTIIESIENSEDEHYESVDDVIGSTWVNETIALLDNVLKGGQTEAKNRPKRDFSLKGSKLDSSCSRLSTSCFDLSTPNISTLKYFKGSQKCHESDTSNFEIEIPSNVYSTIVQMGSVLDINFESPIVDLKNSSLLNTEEIASSPPPPLPLKEKLKYDVKVSGETSDCLLGYKQNSSVTVEDLNKQPMDTSLYQTPIRREVYKAPESQEVRKFSYNADGERGSEIFSQ